VLTQGPTPGLETVKDWSALLLSGFAIASVVYGYTKALVHLNGLGDRVKAIELKEEANSTRLNKLEREAERASDDRQHLHEQVGEAKRAAEQCNDATDQMRADIVGAINDMRVTMSNEMGALRERVKALEVEMHLRNTNAVQPRP
jgi:chromosome segregation ATPase